MRDAEVIPFGDCAIFAIYFGKFGNRNLINRCVVMNVNRERVVTDNKFLWHFTRVLRREF